MSAAILRPAAALALALLVALPLSAQFGAPRPEPERDAASVVPEKLVNVSFDQRLGELVPLQAPFTDESGASVALADYLGERPVILAPVYYDCPMLCNLTLQGLASGLKPLAFEPGTEFDVVAVSFAPDETPELAQAEKDDVLSRYGRAETADGWHFLTGEPESIRELTSSIGFRYDWDEETEQYVHAAGVTVLTPEGRISSYLFGVDYAPKDLKLGLMDAADERIGSPIDQLLLFCFQYDPATGQYSAVSLNVIRLGGVLTVLALVTFITLMLRRDRAVSTAHSGASDVA